MRWTAGADDPRETVCLTGSMLWAPDLRHDGSHQTGWMASNVWNQYRRLPREMTIEVWIRDGKHAGPNVFDVKKTSSLLGQRQPASKSGCPVLGPARAAVCRKLGSLDGHGPRSEGDPLQFTLPGDGPATRGAGWTRPAGRTATAGPGGLILGMWASARFW